MSVLGRFQSDAYRIAGAAGDLDAYQRGGTPRLAKRLVRRRLNRAFWRALGPAGRWPR